MSRPLDKITSFAARNMKDLRISGGLTQANLAAICGVSRPAYTNMEIGNQRITLEVAALVAQHFSCTVDNLLASPVEMRRRVFNKLAAEAKELGW